MLGNPLPYLAAWANTAVGVLTDNSGKHIERLNSSKDQSIRDFDACLKNYDKLLFDARQHHKLLVDFLNGVEHAQKVGFALLGKSQSRVAFDRFTIKLQSLQDVC